MFLSVLLYSTLMSLNILLIQKFIRDPYTATWGGFSKVTNILRDAIFVPEETPKTRQEVKELSQIWANELKVSNLAEPGFEVVTCEVI